MIAKKPCASALRLASKEPLPQAQPTIRLRRSTRYLQTLSTWLLEATSYHRLLPSSISQLAFPAKMTSLLRRQIPAWFLSASLAISTCSVACADDSQKPKPESPVLAAASEDGTRALSTFRIPNSLSGSLFAAEPLVGNPVVFSFDRFGRVFVCESYRQNKGVTDNRGHDDKWLDADLAAMTVQDRIRYHRALLGDEAKEYEQFDDIVRVLVDSDQDGTADKSSIFASGFNGIEEGTGAGVLIRDDQVYFTNIPNLWSLVDKDGDLVADERKSLHTGFGVRVAFRGHDMHGLILGPDGRLYFSIGDRGYSLETPEGKLVDPESGAVFRCELDGTHLEVFATGLRNPQELAFDDQGNLFTGDNNSDSGDRARWVQLVRGSDSGWRMMYQYLPDRGPFNREKIWYPFGPESPAYILPPITNLSDGPSGLVCYPGVGLDGSPDLQGSFFLCDFRGQASNSGIRRIKMAPKGATFEVVKDEEYIWNVLATDADFAPDGSFMVSDWVNGWNGENKGRLYRFDAESSEAKQAGRLSATLLKEGFKQRSDQDLGSLLIHPDRRIRLESQWELAKRQSTSTFGQILMSSDSPFARLHAVWGLGQILRKSSDADAQNLLQKALDDKDEYVVARACEVLAEGKGEFSIDRLNALLQHPSAIVKAQAMLAVNKRKATDSLTHVAKILVDNADQDPVIRHAGIMAFAGALPANATEWMKHPNESVRVAVAVGLRKAKNPRIADMLKDESVRVVREAARAIYDVPELQSELERLATLIIHANYRLGGRDNAARLVSFASSKLGTESLRAEAIGLLGDWGQPGLRDRIMNRHQPKDDRPAEFVASMLQEKLTTLAATTDLVRDEFFKVGAKLKIEGIAQLLDGIVKETNADPTRRAGAITGLARLQPERVLEMRQQLLGDRSVAVRIALMNALPELDAELAFEPIKNAIESTEAAERQAAWDLLGQSKKLPSEAVAQLIGQKRDAIVSQSMPRDTLLNAIEASMKSGDKQTKKAIEAWTKQRDAKQESVPREAYVDCLEGGNMERGRELFFTRSSLSCVRCHKVGETGGDVGPNLSALGKQKDAEYLLEAIVAPDVAIAVGFETIIVLTEDDESISGILKSEDGETLQIMDAQGVVRSVEVSSIVGRKKGLSSMPAGLMKYLNRRELRDLVAYLKSLDGSPEAVKKWGEVGGHSIK
jgi:quinoprotein glucose dehydrogenase